MQGPCAQLYHASHAQKMRSPQSVAVLLLLCSCCVHPMSIAKVDAHQSTTVDAAQQCLMLTCSCWHTPRSLKLPQSQIISLPSMPAVAASGRCLLKPAASTESSCPAAGAKAGGKRLHMPAWPQQQVGFHCHCNVVTWKYINYVCVYSIKAPRSFRVVALFGAATST